MVMATRRRTSSIDRHRDAMLQQSPRNGYYSETARATRRNRPSQTQNRRSSQSGAMYPPNNTNSNTNTHTHRPLVRPRGSMGHSYDPEEGELSENSTSVKSYQSFGAEEEHDSQSSLSPAAGMPKGQRMRPTRIRSNGNVNVNGNVNANGNGNGNGNRSDPELGSNSMHKRALHEAGMSMPMSVLKGNANTNTNNTNDVYGHTGRFPIYRTTSDGSESSAAMQDDSTKSRISAFDNHSSNSSNSNSNHLDVPSGAGSPILTPKTYRFVERLRSTRVWKLLKRKSPIFFVLVTVVSTMGIGLYTQSYATLSVTLDQVITNTTERQKEAAGYFDSIEKDMHILQQKLLELHPDASTLLNEESSSDEQSATHNFLSEASETMLDEIVAVKERIAMEHSKISTFEKYIQETSLRDATRKYGTGVIRVQLSLEFLSDRDRAKSENNSERIDQQEPAAALQQQQQQQHVLILEMAPLELMPHSVYTFLEMVDNNLLDGCSFILNAMNIIKAAPLPYEKGMLTAKQMNENFHHFGLETVSFREYNPAFAHEQYTIGFAADGSPDFYINLGDNTLEHEGEPCFARIVSGFETVQKMQAEPLRSGMWIKKRIGIQKATVL